jgi:3-isopropylmalate/(R)-2-methylmalate dehydratase large subunit
MATGRTWLKVPPTIKVEIQGSLRQWVGGKDLILYILGKLGVEGAAYKALEFTGETLRLLTMDQRLTMANMAVEGGAKNGIFAADDITRTYVAQRTNRKPVWLNSDPAAVYERVLPLNADGIEPQVAFPHSPDNVRPISAVGDIPLDQVFIGSCTNGRLEDLRQAALILKYKKVARQTRLIVLPGSALIYKQALREGILEIFLDAGAVIGPPTCGPCLGGHMGILAAGERALATSNRNFLGRMGHPQSEVYLCGPALAAASAVLGRIGAPEEL